MSRTVYLGTSEFAAAILRRLTEGDRAPELVVTPPDRPKGRGRRTVPCPVAALAEELEIPVLRTADVNDPGAVARIREAGPDLLVVCAFGQIIREPLLSEWLILNVHPSLLPRWRGAAPIERAIIEGDPATGVCIIQLTEGLDSGPVALRKEVAVGDEEDFGSLARRLAETGGGLLAEALDLYEQSGLEFTDQDQDGVTYAEKIDSSERRLDPSRPADRLARLVRGLSPHIGAYLQLPDDDRLGVLSCRLSGRESEPGDLGREDGELFLGCGSGSLQLEVVQAPGKRPMPASEYLRGNNPPFRVPLS